MQRFRSLRRAAVVPVTALGLALLVTSAAQAAPFEQVTYDLGGSSGSSTVTLPLVGDVTVILTPANFNGSQTLRYTSDSGSNIVNGPVSLISFNLTVNAPVYSSTATGALKLATSTLYLQIINLPQGGGTLSGSVINPLGNVATFRVSGQQHCYALCGALGSGVAKSSPAPFQTITFTQALPTLQTAGGNATTVTGTATATFTLDPGDPSTITTELVPVVAVTNLVGKEVSRTKVIPEPSSLLLAGLGLAGLAGAGLASRRLHR